MSRWLYTVLLLLLIPFILLRLVWRGRRQPGYLRHVAERFGYYREAPPEGLLVWLHAVSVGETRAAEPWRCGADAGSGRARDGQRHDKSAP